MSDCLFCKLVANEIPSYTVYEDGETRVFLDIYGCAPGHTIVILKKHGWSLLDYAPDELKTLWTTVQKVLAALTKTFRTEVFTIGMNHKEEAGVHHLHVHLIPRTPEDGGGVIQSIVKTEIKEDLSTIQKKIVAKLK